MSQYLLSVHSVEGQAPPERTPEEMQESMDKVMALEAEMRANGTFVFGGALEDPSDAHVVVPAESGVSMTDGPFAEAKEHIAGFYLIEAADLAEAHRWAARVVDCVDAPIEVRAFRHVSG